MHRRDTLARLAALAAGAALPAFPQVAGRIPCVGMLMFGSTANFQSRAGAFIAAMKGLGYVEGRNVRYEPRSANGQEDLLRTHARELAASGACDAILSASTHTTRVLQSAGSTTPIVMGATEDPVILGFVKSLARPGGNITGVSASVLDFLGRHVELLGEVAPRLTRVTALLNPTDSTYRICRARLEAAVRAGTKLLVVDASTPEQMERAFPSRARDDSDGVIVMNNTLFYNERRTIVELAARARRPAVYPHRGYVEAGGLMSYGPNPEANFARAASYVDRILKGARPAELAIDPPARLELAINRESVRNLGLAVPEALQKQAVFIGR